MEKVKNETVKKTFLRDLITQKYYKHQGCLFQIVYDKFFRKEFFELVINNKARIPTNIETLYPVKWFNYTSLTNIDKAKPEEELLIEIKSLQFLKRHTLALKGSFYMFCFSFLNGALGVTYLVALERKYKYKSVIQSCFMGATATLISLNLFLLIVNNKERPFEKELEKHFEREIFIYEKLNR